MSYKWWKSKHRGVYLFIALKRFTTPTRVQLIAHGCRILDRRGKITRDLVKWKVMKQEDISE